MGQISYSKNDLSFKEQGEITSLLQNLTPKCIPIFVDAEVRRKHYQIFCKGLLWPVFHNIIDPSNTAEKLSEFQDAWVRMCVFLSLEFYNHIHHNDQAFT